MSIQGWLAKVRAERHTYEAQAKTFTTFSGRVGLKIASSTDPVEGGLGIARSLAFQSAALAADRERLADEALTKERRGVSIKEARATRKGHGVGASMQLPHFLPEVFTDAGAVAQPD